MENDVLDLSNILSSKARFAALRTLFIVDLPIPLRHVESLSKLAIRSVQVALAGLCHEKVVLKKRKGRYVLFELNKSHADYSTLRKDFFLIQENMIQKRAKYYNQKAHKSLLFTNEMQQLISQSQKNKLNL